MKESKRESSRAAPRPGGGASKPRVFVIDDEGLMRMLAVESLSNDFDVTEATSGVEALAALQQLPRPDLILLDVMMPDVDGYEVCRTLRARMGAALPILMMTGLDDAESIGRAYEAGATDFVSKPINYVLLVHRLKYLLRSARVACESEHNAGRLARAQRLAKLTRWELDLDGLVPIRELRLWGGRGDEGGSQQTMTSGSCTLPEFLASVHADDRERLEDAMKRVGSHRIEYRLLLPDGRTRFIHQDAEVIVDPIDGHRRLEGAAQDITELRTAEQEVHNLAYFDSLTQLPNRAMLQDFLDKELARAQRDKSMLAVISLDLDGFKRVNDTLGHAAGDDLLREAARRISGCIRRSDSVSRRPPELRKGHNNGHGLREAPPPPTTTTTTTTTATTTTTTTTTTSTSTTSTSFFPSSREVLTARLGGDEFVIVLSNIRSARDAERVAERIAERLSGGFAVGGTEVFVSSSIGIALCPDHADSRDLILDRADVAMYHAKHGGRNGCCLYSRSMHEALRARLDLESALRLSLIRSHVIKPGVPADDPTRDGDFLEGGDTSNKVSEFSLVYQPKVEMPSRRFVGVEALLRWNPVELPTAIRDRGPPSPAEFIPIAEATGLIVPLGAWVLREACQQAKAWSLEYERGLRVAVNVSARQFREPTFVDLVASTLRDVGLDPSLLELEITEGMVMEDTKASQQTLSRLKSLGVRIAIDDFGVGYSSLSYLTHLPIDALKIDRAFIADVDNKRPGSAVASAIIALSHSLNIDVVVEGVETEVQLAFVRDHGNTEVQGYYFARPMTPTHICGWAKTFAAATASSAWGMPNVVVGTTAEMASKEAAGREAAAKEVIVDVPPISTGTVDSLTSCFIHRCALE